jgi:methylphosphotriester-DNA--protein-cysteine methyltransferase
MTTTATFTERPALSRAEMWAAFSRGDARYDGRFVTAVRTTGIFCRPSCTCRKPRPERVEYFPSPSAASRAGYRPCKRCRPELAGGAAEADRSMVARALELMRARTAERLTLADVARSLAMSPSNFARRFRAVTGMSPMRSLADQRAERAESLLANSNDSVLEVALACGFGSASALVRAFRRRTSQTPAAWRTRLKSKGVRR